MKFEKTNALAVAGLLLAIGIAVSSYFLFRIKPVKTAQEIAREMPAQTPVAGNVREASVPESEETEAETMEAEEVNTTPIPFIVKTDSVISLSNSVKVISKSHYLPSQPDCEDYSFTWEEVKLPNKQISARINEAIRQEVKLFVETSEDGSGIPADYCNGEGEFEFRGALALYGHLLHATFYNFTFFRGAAHPNSILSTTCFNINTGKKANLSRLLKPGKKPELDSLILKLADEGGWQATALAHKFREQLPDLNFEFREDGLTVLVDGVNYATTRLTLDLTMAQTAYFLKPEIFEMVYKTPNSFPN